MGKVNFLPSEIESFYSDEYILKGLRLAQCAYAEGKKEDKGEAILHALYLCAMFQAVIPEWVADELETLDDKIDSGEIKDLNEFFGFKPEHSATAKKAYTEKKAHDKVYSALFFHRRNGGSFNADIGLSVVAENTDESRRTVESIYKKNKESLKKIPTKKDGINYGFCLAKIPLVRRYGRKILKDD